MICSPLSAPPRYSTRRDPDRTTFGPAVAVTARALGYELMPWQRHVADVALEILPGDGPPVPAYRTIVLTVPRQSGKTTLQLALFVQRCIGWASARREAQTVVYAAQTRNAAREKWTEHVKMFGASPISRRVGWDLRAANGSESVRFTNGSRWMITANTETAGHGLTLDLPCLDEAFAFTDDRMEQALRPAMQTRPAAQLWIVSTAGTAASVFLKAKIEQGREAVAAGTDRGLAHFEWSAPDDADPDDPETWAACMPALGHTVDLETIRADHATIPPGEWRRAYLNQWTDTADLVIPAHLWDLCANPGPLTGPMYVAADIAPNRDSATIAIAGGCHDPATVGAHIVEHGPGVDWLAPALMRIVRDVRPAGMVIDAGGPIRSYLDDMRARFPVPLIATTTADYAAACGRFVDEIAAGTLAHRADPPLQNAVRAAVRRPMGDAWAWGRKLAAADVTPLVAATLAVWGYRNRPAAPSIR